MKSNQIKELQTKSKVELMKQLADIDRELVKLQLEVVSGKSKNTAILREKRKDIARIQTKLRAQDFLSETNPKSGEIKKKK